MEIDSKLEQLSEKGRKTFDNLLMDYLYDRHWCKANKIDYVNPNVTEAKEKLCNELSKD